MIKLILLCVLIAVITELVFYFKKKDLTLFYNGVNQVDYLCMQLNDRFMKKYGMGSADSATSKETKETKESDK